MWTIKKSGNSSCGKKEPLRVMNGGSGGENILKSKPLSNNTQAPEGRMCSFRDPSWNLFWRNHSYLVTNTGYAGPNEH